VPVLNLFDLTQACQLRLILGHMALGSGTPDRESLDDNYSAHVCSSHDEMLSSGLIVELSKVNIY